MAKSYLNKSNAKMVLLRNFGSIEVASQKLSDKFLSTALSNDSAPLPTRTINYLKGLGYGTEMLSNACDECGVSYNYSNMCSGSLCAPCNNKLRYLHEMIEEPANWDELVHNLGVLSKHFDTEEDRYHADLIEAINVYRYDNKPHTQESTGHE